MAMQWRFDNFYSEIRQNNIHISRATIKLCTYKQKKSIYHLTIYQIYKLTAKFRFTKTNIQQDGARHQTPQRQSITKPGTLM